MMDTIPDHRSPGFGASQDLGQVPSVEFGNSSSGEASERTPLLPKEDQRTQRGDENGDGGPAPVLKLYRRRWYILLVFSLFGALQASIWNTWGPIAASTKVVFAWEDSDIALQANWGAITYLMSGVFFAWVLDVKGLRISALLVAGLLFVASGIRCFTLERGIATWLINIASILNGFAGVVPMAGSPLLSTTWFPANERTRATGFLFGMNVFGVAVSFIIAPLFVHLPTNTTTLNSTVDTTLSNSSGYTFEQIEEMRRGIRTYMYTHFGMVTVVALAVLFYFPAKPPTPPSITASIRRLDFKKGIKDLVRMKSFWMIGGACGFSSGICNGWTAVIDVNLNPLGISESTVGSIAFTGMTSGIVCGVLIAVFADMFARRSKLLLVILYSVGACAYLIFALECARVLPFHIEIIYISMIAGSICVAGSAALLYELTCEETYPIAEGVTSIGVSYINNLSGALFLLIFFIPIESKLWMNWVLVGSFVICVPLFAAYTPSYSRLQVDKPQDT